MPESWIYLTALKMVLMRAAASLITGVRDAQKGYLEDVRFIIVAFGTYTIEELATGTEIETKVEVVGGLNSL